MSESRNLRHAGQSEVERWQTEFDELELRMDALRQAFTEGVRSFALTDAAVERIHARFGDLGTQVDAMRCTYPFGGSPGQEECRFEPPVTYDSDAAGRAGA
jgi:hypothetical protein